MALTSDKLQEIITTADFDLLIGKVENACFDCKSQPYQVEYDAGKRELAKDVSSFANANGGAIFIGIKTKKSATHFGDEVEEIRPFAPGLVNTNQYKDIINSWVYPEPEGLDIEWQPTKTDSAKGVVVIKIPPQRELLKPFLIVRTLDGGKLVETVFGYAARNGDNSQPLSVIDLQRALRSGLNYENQLKEQLDGIEALLKQTAKSDHADAKERINTERVEARIKKALEHAEMSKQRTIVLSAYPKQPVELKTIFTTTGQSIRKHLEQPPILRHGGWTLETLDRARIMRGEMIRVVNGDRKVIDLYRDGVLIFVGLADHDFLGWGTPETKKKINPLAIIEVIYSFVNFYKLVLQDMNEMPAEVSLRVDFRNMHLAGLKNYLVPYQLNSYAQLLDDDKQEAPDDRGTILKSFPAQDYDVGVMSYEIVKEVYLWFGLDEDKIPYTKKENELKLVNAEAIKAAG